MVNKMFVFQSNKKRGEKIKALQTFFSLVTVEERTRRYRSGATFGHAAEHLFSLFLKEKLILLVSETIFMQFFGGCR